MKSGDRWATRSLGRKSREHSETAPDLGHTSIWLVHNGRQDFLKGVSEVLPGA